MATRDEPAAPTGGLTETAPGPSPLCSWAVPRSTGAEHLILEALPGRVTAIVGPNGSGKSALGYWMQRNGSGARVERLIAHRRLWLESPRPDVTPSQRDNYRTNMDSWASSPDSRWLDHAQSVRPGITIYDLLRRENERNASVARLHDEGNERSYIDAASAEAPLRQINRVLAQANLEIQIELVSGDSLEAVHTRRGARYPITEMSDGEKSALLLAAEILTKEHGSIQIIDEPERHLHRSISAGLVAAAIKERADCHFVLLTHDLELAASLPSPLTRLLVVTDAVWEGADAASWTIHAVDDAGEIPEVAKRAILGGRSHILFLEGEADSLDTRLYAVLFPKWTLQVAGGCETVIRAVTGLHTSAARHWLEPRGIVDGDGRSPEEVAALSSKGILSLSVAEVESLYYSAPVLAALCAQQAKALDKDPAELLRTVREDAIKELGRDGIPERLATAVTKSVLQRRILDGLGQKVSADTTKASVTVMVPSPYPGLLQNYRAALAANDLDVLVKSFPIRDTTMKGRVADVLRFKTATDLEVAARSLVLRDESLALQLRSLVGDLPAPTTKYESVGL